MDIRDVVETQHHLTAHQKCDLLDVLKHHQKLFDGSLGVYPHKMVHIEIEPGKTRACMTISRAPYTLVHIQT